MKSFKSLVSEVAQPKPEEEKRFKDQHKVDIAPHPVATEFQHKGTVKPKAKRKADQEGDANYDQAYTVKEEVEELDEISRDLARRYIRKVADKTNTGELSTKQVMKRKPGIELAGKKAYPGIAGKAKVPATESVEELDELSKKTLGSYVTKAAYDTAAHAARFGADQKTKKGDSSFVKAHQRLYGIKKASDKLAKEEVELDEANYIGDTFIKHLKTKYNDKTSLSKSETKDAHDLVKRMSNDDKKKLAGSSIRHVSDIAKDHIKRYIPGNMKKEEVEQFYESDLSSEDLNRIAKDHDIAAKKHSTAYKETKSITAGRNHEVAYNRHVDAAKAHREAAKDKNKHSSEKLEKISNHAWDATDHVRKHFDEEVELDELNKSTLASYIKKATPSAMDQGVKGMDFKNENRPKHFNKAMSRMTGIQKAADKLAKEEVENLGEDSKYYKSTNHEDAAHAHRSIAQRYRDMKKKGFSDVAKHHEAAADAHEKAHEHIGEKKYGSAHSFARQAKAHAEKAHAAAWQSNAGSLANASTNARKDSHSAHKAHANLRESVEQIDELKKSTLGSYVKRAAGSMAGKTAVAAAQASSSMKKSSPDITRGIVNRMKGITRATDKLTKEEANIAENWQEEIPMMMRQLEFIAYAAEEIMDYVDMAGDPEEWFQNKISGIHQSMLSMYAYAQGGRRAGYGFDESVEEELKGGQKKLDHNKNGKLDAQDFHMMRKKKMKEEAEQIDEISQDKLRDYHAKSALDLKNKREKLDKGTLTMKDLKKGQNRVKGLNRAADKMDEEVEILDEAFNQGIVKLKDGSSVALKKEDADLLNQMFKDLSSANRGKMQEIAMKDKAGFEEILGFAREAL
jgi:hypothetical protein